MSFSGMAKIWISHDATAKTNSVCVNVNHTQQEEYSLKGFYQLQIGDIVNHEGDNETNDANHKIQPKSGRITVGIIDYRI